MFLGIYLVALSGTPRLADPWASPEGPPRRRFTLAEACFLFVLVVAAGSVRLFGLDHIPPGGFFDEVQNHLVAEGILKGDRPVFVAGTSQMPALFFYLLAGAIAVAGKGLTTVRGLSALFGTLTLPAFYLLARRAFAWPVAAATAILLAGSRWHITFSRVGFVTIIGPLLEILAVLCLWKAMETRRRLFFLLLGIVTGVGLQCYYSFNLFPAVMAIAVASFAARKGWRSFGSELRPILRGLGWSVLVAVLLLLPLARFAVRYPKVFFERSNTVAIWNPAHHLPWPAILWQNTAAHLLMFNYRGDWNPRHNIPGAPLLNPIEGCLLAVGLGAALARGWKWPQATWLGWFFVMLLPAILTIEAPQAHRAVGAIPAVYLLLGAGLQSVFAIATEGARRARVILVAAVLLAASVAVASQDVWRYFRIQVVHPLAWPAFEGDYHAVARFIKPFANRYEIRVGSVYYDYPILRFHLGDRFPYQWFRLTDELPRAAAQPVGGAEETLYVLEPFQKELFPLFQALYPHARLEEHRDPNGRLMFVSILVSRADLEHPSDLQAGERGFLGAYYANEDWQGAPAILRREPTVMFHFHFEQEALSGSFTADWTANLRVEQPGAYTFEMETSGPTILFVDDQKVIETSDFDQESPRRGTVTLSQGGHRLMIRYLRKGYFSKIWLVWQPPSGERSVIPMRLLRPLSLEEYLGLRDRLPLPQTQ
jgi:4-amino-4-deoxy-L-arabinose transferase-like glycosyltransferase